ncbi:MAG: hypothetical protein MJZ81_07240 [Bacteroidales bacterium]|nr:hypothetical protein [Bacteroidales bacterium]
MLILYKGDDTDFADLGEFVINIDTELDLTGFTGKFVFTDVERAFTAEEIESRQVRFSYTSEETDQFCIGRGIGTFHLYDQQGRHAAVRKVMVEVVPHCRRAEGCEFTIQIDNVIDYSRLGNLPTINGVKVVGDLTSGDLGISISPEEIGSLSERLTALEGKEENDPVFTEWKSRVLPTIESSIEEKVDKVEGSSLMTQEEHEKLAALSGGVQSKILDDDGNSISADGTISKTVEIPGPSYTVTSIGGVQKSIVLSQIDDTSIYVNEGYAFDKCLSSPEFVSPFGIQMYLCHMQTAGRGVWSVYEGFTYIEGENERDSFVNSVSDANFTGSYVFIDEDYGLGRDVSISVSDQSTTSKKLVRAETPTDGMIPVFSGTDGTVVPKDASDLVSITTYSGGDGIEVSDDGEISADSTIARTDDLEKKQDAIVAGDGISYDEKTVYLFNRGSTSLQFYAFDIEKIQGVAYPLYSDEDGTEKSSRYRVGWNGTEFVILAPGQSDDYVDPDDGSWWELYGSGYFGDIEQMSVRGRVSVDSSVARTSALDGKVDKIQNPVEGNVPVIDANGGISDGGFRPADKQNALTAGSNVTITKWHRFKVVLSFCHTLAIPTDSTGVDAYGEDYEPLSDGTKIVRIVKDDDGSYKLWTSSSEGIKDQPVEYLGSFSAKISAEPPERFFRLKYEIQGGTARLVGADGSAKTFAEVSALATSGLLVVDYVYQDDDGSRTVSYKTSSVGADMVTFDLLGEYSGSIFHRRIAMTYDGVVTLGARTSLQPELSQDDKDVLSGGPYAPLSHAARHKKGGADPLTAADVGAYSTEEVDDKINQFSACYLTWKDDDGHYVPFLTHGSGANPTKGSLAWAKANHSAANPQFWYGTVGRTPTKNDYCVVQSDEEHGDKTTRYMFVGEWTDNGYFRYQYTINETALTPEQWAVLESGATKDKIDSIDLKQPLLSDEQLANIAAVPDKRDKSDLFTEWSFQGDDLESPSVSVERKETETPGSYTWIYTLYDGSAKVAEHDGGAEGDGLIHVQFTYGTSGSVDATRKKIATTDQIPDKEDIATLLSDTFAGKNDPPKSHASSHAEGGADAITPQSIGAATAGQLAGKVSFDATADNPLDTAEKIVEAASYGITEVGDGVFRLSGHYIDGESTQY